MKRGATQRRRTPRRQGGFAGILLLASLPPCLPLPARAADALVRTTLATTGDLWVGQRVTVVVELLSPGFFAGAPAFDVPRVPGAIVLPPADRPVVSSETVGDASYAVQRHELAVYPQRPGRVEIPPCAVRFKTRQGASPPVESRLATSPVAFEARLPPGAEGLATLISSCELHITEAWHPEPAPAKVGDAFTRTVVFSAADVPAMVFPTVPAARAEGLGVYPKAPQVRDVSERGQQRGERVETVAYVCERPGPVRVPAMKLTWWDLDDRLLRVVEFPARTFEVAPNPAYAPAPAALARDGRRIVRLAVGYGLGGLVLAGGAWRTRRRWPAWRQRTVAWWRPVRLAPLNPPPKETRP